MTPEHADLHRLVDRLDPEAAEPLLADEPVRDFSIIGLFNGATDLAERSEDILREEFAKRADP